jgi:dienelactone hydrolase
MKKVRAGVAEGHRRVIQGALVGCLAAAAWVGPRAASESAPADPLFDLAAIMSEPVDAVILETAEEDGIVFETLEFTTRITNGTPERIQGIFAYPKDGRSLPAVFWCMGGMAPASRHFPGQFARKGYACLAITLPHKPVEMRRSFTAFDASHPESANLTLLARDQLRGITVLSQRPQVDPDRMAVAGASYGGVFATLIAGLDPRVKAGFSFFSGGFHELGSSLPQLKNMETLEDLAVWNKTIDPAFRLQRRAIPFFWGVAFNDHWFFFPAVAKTFQEAAGTDKRIAIIPYWQHGFLPHVDQALVDFLDTTVISPSNRPAYNAPAALTIRAEGGKTMASFTWTGDNPVVSAEVVASYGEYVSWLGWPHRAAFVFPAVVEGNRATAELPIPSAHLPLVVWGTITDARQVPMSTPPTVLGGRDLAALPVTSNLVLNCFMDGELGDAVLDFYQRMGEPLAGEPDQEVRHSGKQSLRVSPAGTNGAPAKPFTIRHFHNVPGLAHRLSVWLKAEHPTDLEVRLTPLRPVSWKAPLVKKLVSRDERLAPLLPRWDDKPEPLSVILQAGTNWQEAVVAVPVPQAPVEGYKLEIREVPEPRTTYWVDSIRMQPIWPD